MGLSPNVRVNTLFKLNKSNFNDTNNLSQPMQTFNDERAEKSQREYDKEFERLEDNESENIANEFEIDEEIKKNVIKHDGIMNRYLHIILISNFLYSVICNGSIF